MSHTFRLGVFIVSTLTVLAVGVFLIGNRQFMFSSTYKLEAEFKSVSGLSSGAEVRVGGIHKGTVQQIALPGGPDGEMRVLMQMESSTHRVVRQDSVASIQTEGLLGNKYVEVSFGSRDARPIQSGDRIRSQPPLDISDLMNKANDILDGTKDVTDHVAQITSKIDRGEGTVGALVNDKKLYNDMHQATEQAKLGATAFDENMQALRQNIFLRGFFKDRGYSDLAKLTRNEITELPHGTVMRRFLYDPTKIFSDTDTAKLKNSKTLADAGQFLEGNSFGSAVVVVSGGMKGDVHEVHQLAQARAMVVRDYLVNNFKMDDSRFKTMGLGKTTQDSESDNGAVEILVYSSVTGVTGR
jgi:phospholipid/cholesterol/gamma-HCH transport system substrate-binding protein